MKPYLDWIDSEKEALLARVKDWSDINSHSLNLEGLSIMLSALKKEFSSLGGEVKEISFDPVELIGPQGKREVLSFGKAYHISQRKEAEIRFFLGGHYDTVHTLESGFLNCLMKDSQTLVGPGACDMKGGLSIMLTALQALERSPFAKNIGYEILLSPDEEIGSQGSGYLYEELSKECRAALIFEPAFPDEALAAERKGSSNYTIVIKGTSAHAGRNFFQGKSAIAALSELLANIHKLNHPEKKTTLNLGYIYGGGPVNIVPDLALCRLNIRSFSDEQMQLTERSLNEMIKKTAKKHGVEGDLYLDSRRPPKPFDTKTEKLFLDFKKCGEELDQKIFWRSTGGATDGNTIAAKGTPTIDTLGAIGGKIHTKEEYLLVDSLVQRAKLTALFLLKAAS